MIDPEPYIQSLEQEVRDAGLAWFAPVRELTTGAVEGEVGLTWECEGRRLSAYVWFDHESVQLNDLYYGPVGDRTWRPMAPGRDWIRG
jgi:hypothetical protein